MCEITQLRLKRHSTAKAWICVFQRMALFLLYQVHKDFDYPPSWAMAVVGDNVTPREQSKRMALPLPFSPKQG